MTHKSILSAKIEELKKDIPALFVAAIWWIFRNSNFNLVFIETNTVRQPKIQTPKQPNSSLVRLIT